MEQAMVTKAVPIRNRSKIDQFIIVGGDKIEIKAFQTKVVTPALADAFTQACAPHVVRETGGIDVIDDTSGMPQVEYVWLMNATGDPDSDAELRIRKPTKDGSIEEVIPNPQHEPIIVRQRMQGGQRKALIKGEETVWNMGAVDITIFPFSRKAFDKNTADWLLRRDAGQMQTMRGCIKPARAPSGNEPNDTWELEDLQLYAMMLGIEQYGASRSTLEKEASRLGRSILEVVDDTKTELLKRLFFRIADRDYPLPSQEQWEEFRQKQRAAPTREKTKRVVGRPAKSVAQLEAEQGAVGS
jgi:hypothetical protein